MTITPPVVNPVTLDPSVVTFRAPSDIQPFSYKDGDTYLTVLYNIRTWLYNSLVPYLNTNFTDLQGGWQENVDALDDTINAALAQQATNINNALTAQQQQVADELATTLNEITSGESAALNDSAVYNALQVANSQTLAFLDGRYQPKATAFGFYLLSGTGIDLTGATDSTTAVNALIAALPAGSSVRVPSGALITLSDTVQLPNRVHLHGDGELRWVSGIDSKAMIHVTADGTNLDGLYLTNPNHLAAQSPATRTMGIFIEANSVRVSTCRIVGQQQAICVGAAGEFHDFVITGNIILDVPGNGGGPADTTTSIGEDRGDGITVWGAAATIVGNRVAALAGTDARIGIHTEGLSSSEVVTTYPYKDSSVTISGNVVTGKFRRGIAAEDVAGVTIVGNKVWDSTWWGVSVIGSAHGSIIADNAIDWTRTASENQGGAYTPTRAGIMVYGQNNDSIVHDNTIRVAPGAQMAVGIALNSAASTSPLTNTRVHHNRIADPGNGITNGIFIVNGSVESKIDHNDISGINSSTGTGINAFKADLLQIMHNKIKGNSTTATKGIAVTSTGTSVRCDGNTTDTFGTGIALYARSVYTTCNNNVIANSATGIDFFQTTGKVTENSNTFVSVTTNIANAVAGAVSIGNN